MRAHQSLGLVFILCAALLVAVLPASAREGGYKPTHYGLGVGVGKPYMGFLGVDWFALVGSVIMDYERVAPHPAPAPLRFKLEATGGVALIPQPRGFVSTDMFALYYLEKHPVGGWIPYGEAGIGLIYTDFKWKNQGVRINFNPAFGGGLELRDSKGLGSAYLALRFQHASNAGTNKANRGLNSILLMAGALF